MPKKFYITTAIDYVNAEPHIGHAYEKIIADILARWHRLEGEKVFFLTGTDDNASKNEDAAKKAGMPVKEFVDKNAIKFIELCKRLNLSNDDFIRTVEPRHVKVAQEFFKKVYKRGDIYKSTYEGLYCKGCEAFYTEKDLTDGKCPEHLVLPENIKEESYFFKLSKYKDQILNLVEKKQVVTPEHWRNEIISRLKSEELKDISVTRINKEWGIKSPIDPKHTIYVWFDALINYYSAVKDKKIWPADVHVIGKGINWFHAVIWPGMLFSAGLKQPRKIVVHGYLTVNGQKIGKSLGNIIDPKQIIEEFSLDSLRYFLVKEIPFGKDGDFSKEALKARHNNELANDLGNLVSRVLTLIEKNTPILKKTSVDKELSQKLNVNKINKHMKKFELNEALNEIWSFIRETNKHINTKKPWELKKKKLEKQLYTLVEAIRISSILVSPFIPETAEKINQQIGIELGTLKDAKFRKIKEYKVKKGDILFKKIQ